MKSIIFRILTIIILIIVIAVFLFINKENFGERNFSRTIDITNPMKIATDSDNNKFVIDNSMRRVAKLNSEGTVEFILNGGKRDSDSFFYASDITIDNDGNIYILEFSYFVATDYVQRQRIMKYNKFGDLVKPIYTKGYSDKSYLGNGRLVNIKYSDGKLRCVFRDESKYSIIEIDEDTGSFEEMKSFAFNNPQENIIDFDYINDLKNIVFVTKKSEVWLQNDKLNLITSDKKMKGLFVPTKVIIDEKKNIYYADSANGKIEKTNISGKTSEIVISSNNQIISSFYEKNEIVTAIGDKSIIVSDKGKQTTIEIQSLNVSLKFLAGRIFFWICLLLLILLAIYLIILIYKYFLKGKMSPVFIQSLGIVVFVVILGSIIVGYMSNSFTEKYKSDLTRHLKLVAHLSQDQVDVEAINRIEKRSDYMNKDYKKMFKQVHNLFNNSKDDWNNKFYGDVYKVRDNKVFAIMYYNGTAGTYLPYLADYQNSYFKKVYQNKEIISGTFEDAYGEWMYADVPLTDGNGKVIAVLEVGTDLSSYEEYNWGVIQKIIFDMATLLVILILFLIEITIFRSLTKKNLPAETMRHNKIMMIRPIAFVLMLGYSMSMAFVPLYAQHLYLPFFNIPKNVVIGLPISFEMLFIAVSSLLGGYLAEKKGWRPIFVFGLIVIVMGSLISALAWDPLSLIISRSICGFGFGLTQTSAYMYLLNDDKEKQGSAIAHLGAGGYAGLSCGVIIGGILAENFGFSNVFYFIAVVVIITILFTLKMTINTKHISEEKEEVGLKKIIKFLGNKYIILFFIMIYIPVSICSMFLVYFFPIFAETIGYTSGDTGRIFMLYGICIIYFGPVLSRFLSKKIGDKFSTVLYVLLNVIALAVFAFNVSITSAIITVILTGLAEGFGITVALNYLVGLSASKKIGEGVALGFYELMENFGQTIGPIIFGVSILLGYATGIGIIAVSTAILLALFVILTAKEKAKKKLD
jgi:predicted MFS family arabinose efflux permease